MTEHLELPADWREQINALSLTPSKIPALVESWRPVPAEAGDGPDARPAYKLADGEDWEAIAQWCGGRLVSHEFADSGEYDTELRLPGKSFRDAAVEGDWIVRDLNGKFQVLREVESTGIAPVPAEAGDSTPRLRWCDACNGTRHSRDCDGWGDACSTCRGTGVAEAGDSTLPRYFVAPDGNGEPTIWIGTGPDDPNCQPIVRKCTLDGEHPVLWPTVVQALTEQVDPNPEWLAAGDLFGTAAEAGDSTADLEVLADACDDFLTAYRGPSDALIPDMLDLIRRALSGEDPYVAEPTVWVMVTEDDNGKEIVTSGPWTKEQAQEELTYEDSWFGIREMPRTAALAALAETERRTAERAAARRLVGDTESRQA